MLGANLEKANLFEVNFGEPPTIEVGSMVGECCYSPDGQWLAVGTGNGEVKLYQTETLELGRTIQDAQNLSPMDKHLLKQRGARSESAPAFSEETNSENGLAEQLNLN